MGLGQALKELRKQRGFTLADLAEKSDSYVGNLSRFERGVSRPSLELLYRISNALDCPLSEIFALAEPESRGHDPAQTELNVLFMCLAETDRDLLLQFAKLLRDRSSKSPETTLVTSKQMPADQKSDEKIHGQLEKDRIEA